MKKLYQISDLKGNNKTDFYRYRKDLPGHPKYQCKKSRSVGISGHLRRLNVFTLEQSTTLPTLFKREPYMCITIENTTSITSAKTNMQAFCLCAEAISAPPMSKLFDKIDFKRMSYPVHVILMALSMSVLRKSSFRNIALILRAVMNVQISHTTISNW